MSYNYTDGDGPDVLDPIEPDGDAESLSVLDDSIRQIKAYLRDPIASPHAKLTAFSDNMAGHVIMFAGGAAPEGWLICDGSAVSRTDYAKLFEVIGTVYGPGDSVTTFNLPDMRGRCPVGSGVGDAADATSWTIGNKKGNELHQLTDAELPSVSQPINVNRKVGGDTGDGGQNIFGDAGVGPSYEIAAVEFGEDSKHNNLQPSLCVNFIIHT